MRKRYNRSADASDGQAVEPPLASLTPTKSRATDNYAKRVLRGSTDDVDCSHKVFNRDNSHEVGSDHRTRDGSVADDIVLQGARIVGNRRLALEGHDRVCA